MKARLTLIVTAFLGLMASTCYAKDPVPVSCFSYLKQSTTLEIAFNREYALQDGKLTETKDPGSYSIRFTPNEMKIVKDGFANVARPTFTNIKSPGLLLAPIIFTYLFPQQLGTYTHFEILFHSDSKPENPRVAMITPTGQSEAIIDRIEPGKVDNTYMVQAHWEKAPEDLPKGAYAVGLLFNDVLVDRFVFDISQSGYAALIYLEKLRLQGAKALTINKKTGKLKGLPECYVVDKDLWG